MCAFTVVAQDVDSDIELDPDAGQDTGDRVNLGVGVLADVARLSFDERVEDHETDVVVDDHLSQFGFKLVGRDLCALTDRQLSRGR